MGAQYTVEQCVLHCLAVGLLFEQAALPRTPSTGPVK